MGLRRLFGGPDNPVFVVNAEPRRSRGPARGDPLGPPEPLPGRVLDLRSLGRGRVSVVGEAYRQAALLHVSGGRTEDGPARPDQDALLMREPHNQHDPNAVRVCLRTPAGMHRVGYLARVDAESYVPILDAISPRALLVSARLVGGWLVDEDDQDSGGDIGVELDMPAPGALGVLAWLELFPSPKEDHDLVGTRVYFAGESTTLILGHPIDKGSRTLLATHVGCPSGPMAKATGLAVTGSRPHLDKGWPRVKEYGTPTMTEADFWQRVGLAPRPLTVGR